MTRIEILYLLPYLFSLVLSLGVMVYAWRHRQVQGASAYAWLILLQTLMILGFILEMLTPGMGGKLFWDKLQWIATSLSTIALAYFAIQYTEHKIRYPLALWGFVTSLPVLMILAVLTDPLHHFIYPNPHLYQKFIFPELQYQFTWLIYLLAIHGYLVILFAVSLLVRRFQRSPRLFRVQVIAIIIGLLLPILSTVLAIFDIRITPLRDSTPITSAIGNMVIAWAVFRYRLLDIVHIARDKIIESMDDLIFVLDNQNRIIDINPSALRLLSLSPSQVIGKFANPIFNEWPIIMEKFSEPANTNLEIIVERDGKYRHFDVKSTLLYDQRGNYKGRIFVARDITPYAALQWKLQKLNEDLERRVQARTAELAEAYDTTLEGWANALELRDKETEGHSRRVTELTLKLAQAIGVPSADMEHIRRGAILHDIGKMAIPDEILRKAGPLTAEERAIVQKHPEIAFHLLERIPYLHIALEIPYCHHEKWDGTGYPRGLNSRSIPVSARIFAIADVWDAVQSERPYNQGWSREQALAHLQEQSGKYFDPEIVDVFLRMVKEGKI